MTSENRIAALIVADINRSLARAGKMARVDWEIDQWVWDAGRGKSLTWTSEEDKAELDGGVS